MEAAHIVGADHGEILEVDMSYAMGVAMGNIKRINGDNMMGQRMIFVLTTLLDVRLLIAERNG